MNLKVKSFNLIIENVNYVKFKMNEIIEFILMILYYLI